MVALALALAIVVAFPSLEHSTVVTYYGRGNSTSTAPLSIGGITETQGVGTTFTLDNSSGLSILGNADGLIDGSESVLFHFEAGPAEKVSFRGFGAVYDASSRGFNLEGFGTTGSSLGIVTLDLDTATLSVSVSGMFGGAALSGFKLQGIGTANGLSVASVTYTTAVEAVPEPGTVAMLASGLPIVLVAWRRRRGPKS